MTSLIDTSVLVYRFDPRFPDKQSIASELLRAGIADDTVRIAHQAIVEFVAAVIRPIDGKRALLSRAAALREAEELLTQFRVLYPDEGVVRTALRGMAAYDLSWFDAHMWAYAEVFGLAELISEDFRAGRMYGSVKAIDPFR